MERYEKICVALKALANPKRLKIVEMLSFAEMSACQLIRAFDVTQPTLSHDMKILIASGLVIPRPEGRWCYYSLNQETIEMLSNQMLELLSPKDERRLPDFFQDEDCAPEVEAHSCAFRMAFKNAGEQADFCQNLDCDSETDGE